MTKTKRKLIFLWTYREWGGAQIYLLGIMKAALADWDVLAVLPRGSSPELLGYLDQVGVKYEFIDAHLDMDPARTIKRKTQRHWRRIHADVVTYRYLKNFDLRESILHIEIAPWVSWMFLAALSIRGANVFVTVHNALPDFPAWRVLLWKTRMQFVSRLRGFHIFTPNRDTKNRFKGWVEPEFWENIRVTYAAVNPAEIDEALQSGSDRDVVERLLNLDEKRFVILCVGQFIDRKGRWVFLEAAKLALRQDPDLQFVWVMPKLPSQDEIERIAEYGLGDRFRLVLSGSVGPTRHDILRFFRIADIFALPSFVEGLPIALLEAMALGIPSISTNINAIPEAIIDGETGILIAAGDSAALAKHILDLKADPESRKRLSAAGRAFVLKHFDERETSRIAIDAYKECFADGN